MEARCQCGGVVTAIAEAAPLTVACHCGDCRRRSGSPFGVVAYFPREAVRLSGETRAFTRASAAGTRLTNDFCPACGSTMRVLLEKNPALAGVPVGVIEGWTDPPLLSVWGDERHGWVTLPDTARQFARDAGR